MPRALRFCPLPRAGFGESLAGWVAEGDGCVPPRAPRGPVDPSGDGAPQAFVWGTERGVCDAAPGYVVLRCILHGNCVERVGREWETQAVKAAGTPR